MNFQTNVILTQEDADWLDEQTLAIRKKNRKSLSRSALLRGLLQAARAVQLTCLPFKRYSKTICTLAVTCPKRADAPSLPQLNRIKEAFRCESWSPLQLFSALPKTRKTGLALTSAAPLRRADARRLGFFKYTVAFYAL
jgi:hypothetical protein